MVKTDQNMVLLPEYAGKIERILVKEGLRNFLKRKIPCLGIEPTKSTATQAISRGINTLKDFYGAELAKLIRKQSGEADLIICNNVYAHVPDINDFTRAIEISLSENGVVSIEFPHLLNLIKYCQFDTIYHEHFSYLSVKTVKKIFEENNYWKLPLPDTLTNIDDWYVNEDIFNYYRLLISNN